MTSAIPVLTTSRLMLRPFVLADAPVVERLAGVPEVARCTYVPFPYPAGAARGWIESHATQAQAGQQITWAMVHQDQLVGCLELALNGFHRWAELGYWLGVPHWGKGFATEAAHAVVHYALKDLGVLRVQAAIHVDNPASAKVAERLGMTLEGTLRQYQRWGEKNADAWMYAIIRQDRERQQTEAGA
ncbi:GNAT family N-acetyltransferase [Deinococcus cellulosilyticus]|uniref:Acetyltransferase n=1 Tax=Deinococcus cellulosilyticus (strain DSM 18568 / NBRC 106333 / KACC 11606 / 5516J-15) TaxID=1223518 RepID=A0A511N253_DEIC1|nr:GNAT family N-acetyltransferase [Deinococcus cellulosilyticus]GEM46932.1 acetyltransferase [Deinococcus cellulosilyticus NBRC 106333 = KACC 11606]